MSNPLSEFSREPGGAEVEEAAAGESSDPAGGSDFPHLKTLNISENPISCWEALDELRQLPQLVDVRLTGIACAKVSGG